MISKQWLFAAGASAVLALGVAACGDDDVTTAASSGGDTASGLSGPITIDGSSTVQPFAEAGGRALQRGEPGRQHHRRRRRHQRRVREVLRRRDRHLRRLARDRARGGGALQGGRRHLHRGSRSPTTGSRSSPTRRCEISCLTVDQLAQLWTDDTVTNYSELGDDADTGEPLPDAEVSLYGPGTDSGTFDYFTDAINGEEGVSRKDYQASEDDNVLVQGVAGDESGLGYFGFSYYEQNADALNLVSVDDGNGCVAPSAETIQDGSYTPLSRPLFMYPSDEARAEARGRRVHAVRRRQLRHDRRGRADRPDGRDAGAAKAQSAVEQAVG